MAQWAQHGDDGNLWVMVFRKPSLEDVAQYVEARRHFPFWRRSSAARPRCRAGPERCGSITRRGGLERLIHVARLRWGLRIEDWRELDSIVKALATHPRSTRTWRGRCGS
ncbi:hypothetical protein [Streptomyces sp. RKAG337]|uniref:hypothetical protein n=1 Tax=Streptomyces sp. RKAG337 TaxID=2893404 RepID=UPI002033471D|nr:hypothetical protein [Streptomyces sp. RKAG337]MCM2424297.1 hypothetical protein [Streptomyces sp. RKAG337]